MTTAALDRVVEQIVAHCRPDKVVLFGSRAHGTATPDSDADLLVIMRTSDRPIRIAAEIAAAIDHPIPLDILVRTPDEITARLESGDSFISDVLTRGVVLYEARDERMD